MFKKLASLSVIGISIISLIVGNTFQNYYAPTMNQLNYSDYDFASRESVNLDKNYYFEPIAEDWFLGLTNFLDSLHPYMNGASVIATNFVTVFNALLEFLRGDILAPSGSFTSHFGYDRVVELYNSLNVKWYQIIGINAEQSLVLYYLLSYEERVFLVNFYETHSDFTAYFGVPMIETRIFRYGATGHGNHTVIDYIYELGVGTPPE